ncbi:transcription initiation factor TFIID subunit 4-like [Pan paniscus]|uniref:transcription initiation factor TFIID subunit 4-like n=1 Tax=Pan paniscus TaxID=9597 RepID=UPI003005F102
MALLFNTQHEPEELSDSNFDTAFENIKGQQHFSPQEISNIRKASLLFIGISFISRGYKEVSHVDCYPTFSQISKATLTLQASDLHKTLETLFQIHKQNYKDPEEGIQISEACNRLEQFQNEVPLPRAHASKQARSGLYRYPTRRWPADGWVHLRAPSSLPQARGAGRGPSPPRPRPPGSQRSPPCTGRKRRGGDSGEVKGLTFWTPGQQCQTPNTHLREEPAEPKPALPAFPIGRREAREGSAREGSRSQAAALPSRRAGRPPGAKAADAQTAESGTISQALAAANGSPLRSPPPPPDPRTSPNEFPAATAARAAAPAPGLRAPARRGSTCASPSLAAPGPCRERCAPTLGCSSAAKPRLMLRPEVAASPAAGGGCTRTRRGGEGALRPGPCSRGPARGCHLEARRRSRGTTGGGSGSGSSGDGSSST